MDYATQADMVIRFGELEIIQITDRDRLGAIDSTVLAQALADATAYADGFLGKVYQLPLRGCAQPGMGGVVTYTPPPVLTRIVCDLARYYLFTNGDKDHEAVRRYKQAITELTSIGDGDTQLSCPLGGTPGDALHADAMQAQGVDYCFAPRQMSDDNLRGFA
nr:DUF1320 domain-containing protein [uncultured Albidiferax sp.]